MLITALCVASKKGDKNGYIESKKIDDSNSTG